ncbi:DNA-directed RNA polymerase mitochondrial precursor [Bimuria novae-zelandiae CBS 107.79]|uniref:DNA-directed RNA polymerase n=1 Tax=Bimuria novae-zelandiae CBS 107.79 TaxID=1447943 RepID=A0A6A5VFX2_9PLEO|nr:DNA-directed RNA polymerase mitochondrial precursor [Bimuria novae-zelandiae CBS 107.79]
MLVRAARRKLRRDAFRSPNQLAEQLALPWQRPSQIRWAASVGPAGSTTHDARRPRHGALSLSTMPRHETRSLATQADVQPSHMPSFDGMIQPWGSRSLQQPQLSRLKPWDPSAPLVLRDPMDPPTATVRFGIGGDPIELYQNLHACLRVGRMDRATAIIQRLTAMYSPTASEVVEAHNAYLQTMSELAQHDPEAYSMATIEEWYDEHMVRKAIEPNAGTFIILLRSSMTLLEGSARHRSLRKYLAMAQQCCGEEVLDTINYSEDFDDQEWDALIRAQPERFKEPAPLEQQQDMAQQYDISTPLGVQSLIEHGIIANPEHTVKEVPQKGEGLNALKNALATFHESGRVPYPHEMEGSQSDKERAHAYMRQLQIERDAVDSAIERWKIEDEKLAKIGVHGVLKTKRMQALMWQWYSVLLPRIKKEMARTKEVLSAPSPENSRDERHVYGPFLELCSPEKLAAITVSRVLQSAATGRTNAMELKVANLSSNIGEDIRTEANADAQAKLWSQRKKERKRARRAMLDTLSLQPQNAKPIDEQNGSRVDPPVDSYLRKEIPVAIKTRLGALMMEHFLQAATITVTAEDPKTGKTLTSTQAAFHHHMGYANGKKTGWIVPHQEILEKISKEPTANTVHSVQLPMVFEPKPWTAFDDGGYYTSSHGVVRMKNQDHSQRAYAESAIANGDMEKLLSGLDVLSKVPWQINKDVFKVMVQAWNSGEGIGAMVAENDNLVRPKEPPADAPESARRQWIDAIRRIDGERSGLHSQRSFQNYQLETARAYVNEKRLYFPHNVDFRGRAYPISPVLNHMGSDFSRCLLRFANGKELGSVGLQWLKVHLANLYGYDKASLHEREKFAMDNIDEVFDSAKNPLTGRRWWTKGEDPWQCLACCMELTNAMESPDPTRFVSHLPVHQDGTCNGLQHYAALGGDFAGASQVNLEPSDRPQDIYTGVAELVKGMIEEDAAKGKKQAILLKGKITRKVVKRTVMTNVYGVTFIGAKAQVEDELRATYQRQDETTEIWHAASYVAVKIFDALGKIFNGAQEIQYWLGECGERILTSLSADQIKRLGAHLDGKQMVYDPKYKKPKRISQSLEKKLIKDVEEFKTPIIWTTPLKMPVVQPYRKAGVVKVKTQLQDVIIAKAKNTGAVDKRKQLQAFPPNFIHSLDATHMLLSALKCSEMGVDFAAVHDSFWTHAADIPTLNVILRDAFVRMHSEDIMGRLRAEFNARYAGSMYKAQLKRSSVAAKKIIAWRAAQRTSGNKPGRTTPYDYKDATFAELALEARRQELLNSENPEEKEKGREMVTPTSIWLANQDPSAIASYRLALLGETKNTAGRNFDEAKDKILSAEAEQVSEELEAEGKEPKDLPDEKLEAVEEELAEGEDDFRDDFKMADSGTKKVNARYNTMAVWLPLTFPPVPKKGGWDVSRLRDSKYFFS